MFGYILIPGDKDQITEKLSFLKTMKRSPPLPLSKNTNMTNLGFRKKLSQLRNLVVESICIPNIKL